MNAKIKELAMSAGFLQFTSGAFSENIAIEKFAELIVRECAEVSFNHWEQHKGCSAHFPIREHFGIKE